jgi:hypothetical protein
MVVKENEQAIEKIRLFHPYIIINFEDLIKKPELTANCINAFLCNDLHIGKMVACVIDRPVTCMPSMNIELNKIKANA